ncbi:hypothetical protein D034_2893A, partial [Vibrio parahaemolyticus Peru-288]
MAFSTVGASLTRFT